MSGAKLLRQVHSGNRLTDDNNKNVELAISQARKSPFWAGQLVTGIVFQGSVPQNVNHKLGRPYQGWVVVRLQSNGTALIFEPLGVTPAQAATVVPLEATSNCVASIWFF